MCMLDAHPHTFRKRLTEAFLNMSIEVISSTSRYWLIKSWELSNIPAVLPRSCTREASLPPLSAAIPVSKLFAEAMRLTARSRSTQNKWRGVRAWERGILEDISQTCLSFQSFSQPPIRFNVLISSKKILFKKRTFNWYRISWRKKFSTCCSYPHSFLSNNLFKLLWF